MGRASDWGHRRPEAWISWVAKELLATTSRCAAAFGWFELEVSHVQAGERYGYRIGGGMVVPDPASRSNTDGVDAPSELIDPSASEWPEDAWHGRPRHEVMARGHQLRRRERSRPPVPRRRPAESGILGSQMRKTPEPQVVDPTLGSGAYKGWRSGRRPTEAVTTSRKVPKI